MAKKLLFILVFFFLVFINIRQAAFSQEEEFGPICDDVTVICSPTVVAPTSVPTSAPQPTSSGGGTVPTATSAPTSTPRTLISAGTTETFNFFLLAGTALIIMGGMTSLALFKAKN